MTVILITIFLHWYLSLFCQSFFLHRYSAHGMFTMSKFWEKFFYLLTYLTQGSSFLNPRAYAILHRMHHAYSDSEKDPHSPHFHPNVFRMMWMTKNYYAGLVNGRIRPEDAFDRNFPVWRGFDAFAESWVSRVMWMVIYILFYATFATAWWMFLILPFHFAIGPIQGAVVNWCGHKYGYQNFDNRDKSRNSLFIDFLMIGELFQNNHHKLPNRANFAVKWFEFDPTYPMVRILNLLHIIRLRKSSA